MHYALICILSMSFVYSFKIKIIHQEIIITLITHDMFVSRSTINFTTILTAKSSFFLNERKG